MPDGPDRHPMPGTGAHPTSFCPQPTTPLFTYCSTRTHRFCHHNQLPIGSEVCTGRVVGGAVGAVGAVGAAVVGGDVATRSFPVGWTGCRCWRFAVVPRKGACSTCPCVNHPLPDCWHWRTSGAARMGSGVVVVVAVAVAVAVVAVAAAAAVAAAVAVVKSFGSLVIPLANCRFAWTTPRFPAIGRRSLRGPLSISPPFQKSPPC